MSFTQKLGVFQSLFYAYCCIFVFFRIFMFNLVNMPIYTQALVRKPGKNFSEGLTEAALSVPDFKMALQQHTRYVETLLECGLKVTVLEADERYPDGCFVEDTAIITEKVAIITNPGAASRKGEEQAIKEVLSSYKSVLSIRPPGTLEGGDVLRVEDHFYIGVSKRTNPAGADQLSKILEIHGYISSHVPVTNVLHLKTGVTYIQNNTVVIMEEFKDHPAFAHFNKIVISEANSHVANCLPINDKLLIAKGHPGFRKQLANWELEVVEMDMSEFGKMDGGLTCLSLLF